MKIGILNAYDARNRGDLAIVLCQIQALRREFGDAEFFVFSHHAAVNNGRVPARSVESLIHVPPGRGTLRRLWRPVADAARWWAGSRHGKYGVFRECDLYALCGGGYLYSSAAPLLSRNLACLCLEARIAAHTGKPVIQFPQSFGPVTKTLDRWIVRGLCRRLPQLTPRCEYSMRLLDQWGFAGKAVFMPDIVLLMRRLFPEFYRPVSGRRGIGIAPVNYRFALKLNPGEHETYVSQLAALCRHFHQRTGEPAVLFAQVCVKPADDDSVLVDEVAARLERAGVPHERVAEQADLAEYVSRIGALRLFVGSRMHACIFGLTSRTPVLGLAYQPKFEGVYRQLQLEAWLRPLNGWTLEWARSQCDAALAPDQTLQHHLESQMDALEERMEAQLRKLLLAATSSPRPQPAPPAPASPDNRQPPS